MVSKSAASEFARTSLPELIRKHEASLLDAWMREQLGSAQRRAELLNEGEVRQASSEFLRLLSQAIQSGRYDNFRDAPEWKPVRDLLSEISRSRGLLGLSPSETAMFIFSFKRPLFEQLRKDLSDDAEKLASELWGATLLLDSLGLFTTEVHQRAREDVIARQQAEMLELSTPVVKMWDGILALPMIGTLDSNRTQIVMEALLQRIVETGSEIAIIDITGVPTVDTLVAQHLLKTVTAARLMGAECIISGIRPQIAATIVHLGVDLGHITTKASLADAFAVALTKLGMAIGKPSSPNRLSQPARA